MKQCVSKLVRSVGSRGFDVTYIIRNPREAELTELIRKILETPVPACHRGIGIENRHPSPSDPLEELVEILG